MSRLRYFLLFAAIAVLATTFVACGSSGGSSNANPQTVINEATLKGIESGKLDLSLTANVAGEEGGKIDVGVSGPFQSQGKGQLPEFDLAAKANGSINGKAVNFDGGLTLLNEKAFVNYEGTEYEVDPTTFSFVKSAIEQAQEKESAKSSGATGCQEAASSLKVADFVENPTNEGSSEVGGTTTTHISGELNPSGAIAQLIKLTENPACAAQLGQAGQVPSGAQLEKAQSQLQSALKKAHVDIYVGGDHIIREIAAELEIEPPGSGSGPQKVDLSFQLKLEGVNEEQPISAPSGAKPLNDLFLKLHINPIELLNATGGGAGLGGLLNGVTGATSGGSSESSGGEGGQAAYLQCLQGASTAAAVQKCAAQLK